ncbi:hypothetical protein, partial [Nocardia farcinica]|uniref:hypothetical protein n=1 Tax=Nocardia farcinica TaxID=37329 RepID=UPI002454CAEF
MGPAHRVGDGVRLAQGIVEAADPFQNLTPRPPDSAAAVMNFFTEPPNGARKGVRQTYTLAGRRDRRCASHNGTHMFAAGGERKRLTAAAESG